MVGCDGAGSRVRKLLGIEMQGPPLIQCFLMIHFGADLRALTGRTARRAPLRPRPGGRRRLHRPRCRVGLGVHARHRPLGRIRRRLRRRPLPAPSSTQAAGAQLDAEILGRGTWWMSAQTADSMGGGRIFLAGDAAHRFPPTGGLGLNCGVQDIHALMWRIGAVVRVGPAGAARLLRERAHPGRQNNAHQSLTNALKMVHLAAALGTDVEPTSGGSTHRWRIRPRSRRSPPRSNCSGSTSTSSVCSSATSTATGHLCPKSRPSSRVRPACTSRRRVPVPDCPTPGCTRSAAPRRSTSCPSSGR